MKKVILILLTISIYLNGYTQHSFKSRCNINDTVKIKNWIVNIHNDQLYGTCHYAWVLEMKSEAGDSLIKAGEKATKPLLGVLTHPDKGIIAHYILCHTHMDTLQYSSSFDHFEKDSTLDYNYCGLKFFDKNGHIFTTTDILEENKKKWSLKF